MVRPRVAPPPVEQKNNIPTPCNIELSLHISFSFADIQFNLIVRGFGWRRHFGRVAEFAEFVALALNGAVIAEQRAEFAAAAAQIFIVRQHVVASQRHDGVNLGVVHIFGGALEQVLVQLQQFGPLVAHAMRRRQLAQIGADPHGAIRARELQRHLVALGLHLQHAAVKVVIVRDALAALHEHCLEIKERQTDVYAIR